MALSADERSGIIWSLGCWLAAIVGAIVVGVIVGMILDEAAGGIIFAGVTFMILGFVLTQHFGPPASDAAAPVGYGATAAGHGHAAPAAPVAAPVATPVATPVQTPPPAAPDAGAISERVRDAARAAGEAARAALGDMAAAATPVVAPSQPPVLAAAREGGADDLKRIKGVGPKLEEVLHGLGFYHFDQIAAWTPAELDWVDAHLEGFNGRAERDDWVGQSKILAAGGETEHSQRVDRGEST